MSYLLDTNVLSEWVRPRPDPGLGAWLRLADEDTLFLSVVTLAELRHGTERLPEGRRRKRLEEWLEGQLPSRFEGRLVPVDAPIADEWGRLVAQRESQGRPIGAMDALIAATARVLRLTVVTRNTGDFELSVAVLNPWSESS